MNEKILIVDDEPRMLQLFGMALEHVGYRIAVAQDANQALAKAQTENPDLIILDVMLPGVSGLELCQQLRHEPRTANIPIIMLSAKVEVPDRIAGLRAGADEYVIKPVIPAELIARIESLLERIRRFRGEDVPKAGKVLTFVGAKGGVGTTTVVLNLGIALVMQRKSVVAAELRAYPGSFPILLGLRRPKSLGDLMTLEPRAISARELSQILPSHSSGLQVLCAPPDFGVQADFDSERVKAIIAGLAGMADYVVLDLPPHPVVGFREAIQQSHTLVLVMEPVRECLESAMLMAGFLKSLAGAGLVLRVAIVNRVPIAMPVTRCEIENKLGWEVIVSLPMAADDCSRAQLLGKPVVQSQPDATITQMFKELALILA